MNELTSLKDFRVSTFRTLANHISILPMNSFASLKNLLISESALSLIGSVKNLISELLGL